jgi:hypothetical protein
MPPSKSQLYERAREELEKAWLASADAPSLPSGLNASDFGLVMSAGELAPRYALVTQLVLKIIAPPVPARQFQQFQDAPSGFSSRSLAKAAVVPFDADHDALLGGSADPYVSNPLRRAEIDESVTAASADGAWSALLRILDSIEGSPNDADTALVAALHAARSRQLTLRRLLEQGLTLQARRQGGENVADERNELFQRRGPAFLAKILPNGFASDGGAQVGSEAEVPWVRIFSPGLAPSAQEGWYLVYLFAADGSAAFLALMQGVTHAGTGAFESGASWVRELLGDEIKSDDPIDLRSKQGAGSRPARYEKATVYAKHYDAESLPRDDELREELNEMLGILQRVYAAQSSELPPLSEDFSKLTLELVLEAAAESELRIPDIVAADIVAALRAHGEDLACPGSGGGGSEHPPVQRKPPVDGDV